MNTSPRRLSFVATIAESARQTASSLLRDRMVWILIVSSLALAALGFVLGPRAEERLGGRKLFCLLAWWLQGTVLVPWTTLYLGISTVHGSIEDRTFQYTFLRPVDRGALLLGKWVGVCLVAVPLAVFGVLVLFAALASRPGLWPDGVEWTLPWSFALVLSVGAATYAAVAMLFGAWFRRPLVMAALFVVGLQTLTANLDVSAGLRRITVIDPMRRMLLDSIEPEPSLVRQLWPAERDFRSEHVGTPMRDLAVLAAVCAAIAAWLYRRTEYDSRERE